MKNSKFILLLLFVFAFSGCINEPVPCFEPSNGDNKADVGQSISFSNCSIFSSEFEWNFGDGTTSTEYAPSHTYTTTGNFTVTLKAYSKGKKKSGTVADLIQVGNRSFTSVRVQSYPSADSLGNAWDAADSADIVFRMGPSGTWALTTTEATNAVIPYTWTISSVAAADADWSWELIEVDGLSGTQMASGTFNPATAAPSSNEINLTSGATSIFLGYQIQ